MQLYKGVIIKLGVEEIKDQHDQHKSKNAEWSTRKIQHSNIIRISNALKCMYDRNAVPENRRLFNPKCISFIHATIKIIRDIVHSSRLRGETTGSIKIS